MVYRAAAVLMAFFLIRAAIRLMLRLNIVTQTEAGAVFFGAVAIAIIAIEWIIPQHFSPDLRQHSAPKPAEARWAP